MHVRLTVFLTAGAAAVAVATAVTLAGVPADPSTASTTLSTATASTSTSMSTSTTPTSSGRTRAAFRSLEHDHHATLGVTAIDTADGRTIGYRAGTRFPFASSNKTFIVAATLARSSDADLDTVVHYGRADLLSYAPVTTVYVDRGMTVRQLIDAALRFSDNTAANLLVERLGGPEVVEQWLRGIGDRTTEVDRTEPDLNQALPGDERDTTTPAQFALDLRTVVLGHSLETADRTLLRNEMLGCTTGDGTIRAGVDPAWPVADKTGTGEYGVRDDIAVVYPTGRAPIVVTTMSRQQDPTATPDDALLAAATTIAIRALRVTGG
ncbi:class A beta-lactamase [Curtobacterium sp. RRHDQ10]|uniref:class A beta-lactamase n=1 Tax=Curtobacterium phyllosphaerae TaxID=3413379 RepID=UPI003BF294E9